MDIARPPEVLERRRRRRIAIGAGVSLLVLATTVGLARLRPAAPTVEAGTLWIDTVKRGTIYRQVHGTGVLVPDDIRWITALTDGRVERVPIRPGTAVTADTVLLELSNPQAEQAALTAELDLKAAKAQY
jgi:HlyD family secretion protein